MEETKFLEENDQLNQLSMNILVHAGSARDHLVHSLESFAILPYFAMRKIH